MATVNFAANGFVDILKQCQKWHEEDKHQKIVDALEAISAEERTPEMDM